MHDRSISLAVGGKAVVVVELGFEMREPVLGHRVVPADSGAAHRLGNAVASTPGLKLCRGILTASVGINPNSG